MKNSEYWRLRFLQLEAAQNQKAKDACKEIEKQYKIAQQELEERISVWYARLASNNGITVAGARKLLTSSELKEFKWNVQQYVQYGAQSALDATWMKELENASAKYHITKLEALKIQTQQSLEVMFQKQMGTISSTMQDIFKSGYYHTAYEIQKGFGVGFDIAGLDERQVTKVISKPWAVDGKNFSERIWGNKKKLIQEAHNELTQNILLGADPQRAINHIAKKMDTSKYNAGRLVMTEEAYFSSVSQKDCFMDLDVEEYEVVATLDSHTSAICKELDGKVYSMKDYEAGVTAPPFHVYCRSTTVPHFDDEWSVGERAARGEDGKTYYVPENMKYQEWEKIFVDGGSKDNLKSIDFDGIIVDEKPTIIKRMLELSDFPSEFTTKTEGKNTQKLIDFINSIDDANPNVVNLYGSMGKLESITSNNIPFSISHSKGYSVEYSYRYGGDLADVKLTIPKLVGDDLRGQVNTTLHEEMHLLDLYCRKDPSKYKDWFSTEQKSLVAVFQKTDSTMQSGIKDLFQKFNAEHIKITNEVIETFNDEIRTLKISCFGTDKEDWSIWLKDRKKYEQYEKEYKRLKKQVEVDINYKSRNAMGGGISNLQDIYDALSQGYFRDTKVVIYGHGGEYYRSIESRIHETVANYGALSVTRPDLIDMLRVDKPELVEELDNFIQAMLEKVGG